jgi:HSP20 family protein
MRVTWNTVSPLERVFDDVMGSTLGTAMSPRTFQPSVDVRANDDEVVFLCDVPGLEKEDLEITIENHVLTIKGARKFESKEGEQVMLGRAYGSFRRAFRLPDSVDEDGLSADLADGVLSIRVPKQAKAKPKKIEIGGGNGNGSKRLEK